MTGESGHFLIQDLVPGKYILVVRRIGAPPYRQPIEIVCGKNPLGRILLSNCSWRASRPVAVGTFDAADLDVTIRPAKKRYHVGEPVTFEVWITNRGTQPTVLVRSVDGSDVGASPSARISIAGPAGGFVVQPFGRCGNRNAAGLDDFFEVAPGESLDPFSGGWTGAELAMGRFEKPGDYTATFHYSTTSTDPRTWMGGSSMSGRCELPAALRELLDRVPPVELTARTTFYVGW